MAFAVAVAVQYSNRRKPYQATWAAALAMFSLAAFFETYGQLAGWSDFSYKGYYLFGGLLNVGWLGVGSLQLLASPRIGRVGVYLMTVVSSVAVGLILVAHTDASLLRAAVPARGAITVVPALAAVTNIIGSVLLVGGAAWSAWRAYRANAPRDRVLGTALLAAGAFIVAGGHSYAQTRGVYAAQPVSEALGIVVMFAGYLEVEQRSLFRRRSASPAH